MPVKNKVNQLISHLSYFLYIISGIVLLSNGRTALAIDYIEITNPKFIPVKVGVAIGAGNEADEVQKVFNNEHSKGGHKLHDLLNKDLNELVNYSNHITHAFDGYKNYIFELFFAIG